MKLLRGGDPTNGNEFRNLLRLARHPALASALIQTILKGLWRGFGNRFLRQYFLWYPDDLRRMVKDFHPYSENAYLRPANLPYSLPSGPRHIRLAGTNVNFINYPDWSMRFEDHEDHVSLHRWGWLLTSIDDGASLEWGWALVRSWLQSMTPTPIGDAGESYTIGERISNACLFARLTAGGWVNIPKDIQLALNLMAQKLSSRLEYQPGELTGNHVINNARALLFAGHSLNTPEYILLARKILEDRLAGLLTKDGFLREGSSHYHFLFTRWLLEMHTVAFESGDKITAELLEPHLKKAIQSCHFFLVNTEDGETVLTTFGDISPDCTPEWLVDLPYSTIALGFLSSKRKKNKVNGWAKLFETLNLMTPSEDHIEILSGWSEFPESGWYRLDQDDWVAIWHAEDANGDPIASHAHNDLGGAVIFYKGREFLIDPGRINYTSSSLGLYGLGAHAHSTVVVNNLPPMLTRRDRFYPNAYRKAHLKLQCSYIEGSATFTIRHNGFSRISGLNLNIHRRIFKFSSNVLSIEDEFYGDGSAIFEMSLQLASSVNFQNNDTKSKPLFLEISGKAKEKSILFMKSSEYEGSCRRFPSYGHSEYASSLTTKFRESLPLFCEIKLKVN